MKSNKITRRFFIISSASAVGGCAMSSKLTSKRIISPSEKLNIAGVGIGAMGHADMDAFSTHNIVALCDVDWKYAAPVFEKWPKAKKYKDYRNMLEKQKDIDAVVVATPDHMHASVAMAAIKAGKHVYCEKPLTHTIDEARKLSKAARKAKVATQMGNRGQADEHERVIREYIDDGAIGTVREVHVWTNRPVGWWPQAIERPETGQPVPDTLDWDLWLGRAPERPYNRAYHPFIWRGWYDFGTGALGDMACHRFDPVFKNLDLGHPISVDARTSPLHKETYPNSSIVRYQFPARGNRPSVRLIWYDGGYMPPQPEELDEPLSTEGGTLYVGDKGKMLDGRLIPESRMKEYPRPAKTLERSPGHFEEFVEACKGGKLAGADFSFAGPLTEVVLLGNIAIRTGKRLEWSGRRMQVVNVPAANDYIYQTYRKGWEI